MHWITGLLIALCAVGVVLWWRTGGAAWLIAASLIAIVAVYVALRRRGNRARPDTVQKRQP